jgi:intein/homing endonuclease
MHKYFIEEIGLPAGKKAEYITIPERLLKSKHLNMVIRGIIDTDGYLYLDKRKAYRSPYPRIELTTKSIRMADQLTDILKK